MSALGNQTRYQDAPYYEGVGDGVTLAYALSWQPGFPGALMVVIGGVPQPTSAYQVSGYNLLLSSAPATGARILVFGRGVRGVLPKPAAGSVDKSTLAADVSDALTLPIGAVSFFAMNTPPAGWMECNGALISRTTYADLFSVIGTTFGAGDGSTTFGLPDLRGEFLRGWDHAKGVDTGRAFGTNQVDDFKSHTHLADTRSSTANGLQPWVTTGNASIGAGSVSLGLTGGTETRPRNVAMLPCIKAFSAFTNFGIVDLANLANEVSGKVRLTDFLNSNVQLAANGYQKLPSGLIVQWATINSSGSALVSLTLPIAFPNNFLRAYLTCVDQGNAVFASGQPTDLSHVAVSAWLYNGTRSATPVSVLALGY